MRNKPVKDALLRIVHGLGADIADRTPYSEVRSLIRLLRPLDSGVALIRVGPDGDGGYLIPDDLDGIEHAFSPGVATQSGFEAALAARGIGVFLADFSVAGPAEPHPAFVFDKKFVGALSNDVYMTLDDWKRARIGDHRGDLLLQMDIEGAEFETLLSASADLLAQFRIMNIEFHSLQELFNRPYFELASRVFRKLLQTHGVVHIHPNNCCGSIKSGGLEVPRVAELTFYRHDRFRARAYCTAFPHALDRDNTRKPTLVLPECWYR